jgi:hypothetical protein
MVVGVPFMGELRTFVPFPDLDGMPIVFCEGRGGKSELSLAFTLVGAALARRGESDGL